MSSQLRPNSSKLCRWKRTRTDVLTLSVISFWSLNMFSRYFKFRQGTNAAPGQDLRISLQEHGSLRHWEKGCRDAIWCDIHMYDLILKLYIIYSIIFIYIHIHQYQSLVRNGMLNSYWNWSGLRDSIEIWRFAIGGIRIPSSLFDWLGMGSNVTIDSLDTKHTRHIGFPLVR